MRKSTTAEFIEKAKKLHGDKYDYSLVEYINSYTKVKIICPEHGVFEQKPNGHLDKKGCLECGGNKKSSKDEFIQKSKKVHDNKYDYSLVNYINARSKVKIICPTHGVFEQNSNSHIIGYGCSKCSYNDSYVFIEKSKQIHGNKYNYSLVNYINALNKIIIICPEHGEFTQLPYNHLNGNGCKECCTSNKKLKIDEFIQKSIFIHGDKYDYSLVNYKDSKTKVKIMCEKHGIFEQKPNEHLNGRGCAICKESKGERIIRQFLLKNNIEYIRQKTFNDCLSENNNKLRFDFFIYNYNLCVEFDGVQHFKAIEYWNGEDGLKIYKIRDKIKNEYCKNNNIRLIRIRYDENIEEILNNYFL